MDDFNLSEPLSKSLIGDWILYDTQESFDTPSPLIIEEILTNPELVLDVMKDTSRSYAIKENYATIGPRASNANAFIQTVNGMWEGMTTIIEEKDKMSQIFHFHRNYETRSPITISYSQNSFGNLIVELREKGSVLVRKYFLSVQVVVSNWEKKFDPTPVMKYDQAAEHYYSNDYCNGDEYYSDVFCYD